MFLGCSRHEFRILLCKLFLIHETSADGHGKAVAAGALDKLLRLRRIGQQRLVGSVGPFLLDTFEMTQFCFDCHAPRVGEFNNALCHSNVALERQMGCIDHYRAVMARGDRVHTGVLVAMIVMNGEVGFRINRFGSAQQLLEHERVSVVSHDARELHYDWRASFGGTAEQTVYLFQIANIERADGVAPIGGSEKFVGGDAHEACGSQFERDGIHPLWLIDMPVNECSDLLPLVLQIGFKSNGNIADSN